MPIYSWRSNDELNTPGLRFASSIVDFLIKEEKTNPEFHQELLETFHEVVVKGTAGCDKILDAGDKLYDVLKDNLVRWQKHADKVRGRVETFEKAVQVFGYIVIGAGILMMGDLAWRVYVTYKSKSESRKATAAARRKEEEARRSSNSNRTRKG